MSIAIAGNVKIKEKYLLIPVLQAAPKIRVIIRSDDAMVYYFNCNLSSSYENCDFIAPVDLSRFTGKTLAIGYSGEYDKALEPQDLQQSAQKPQITNLYQERLRPQIHFSAPQGWLNDPNGLIFHEGEYHLYYQYNPFGCKWDNMHWAHAVSRDLFHWEDLGIKMYPDHMGTMYSGCAVLDPLNTTGLERNGKQPILFYYTAAGSHAPQDAPYTQCLACSYDNGRTLEKYPGNPLIPQIGNGNRDPKVFWHAESSQWVSPLYIDKIEDEEHPHRFGIFVSKNGLDWQQTCEIFFPGTGECPDLYPLADPSDTGRSKWVFSAADGMYYLGDFDGNVFTAETEPLMLYNNNSGTKANGYAAQSYSNIPQDDGRRIQIAWMQSEFPQMCFNQQMTIPVVMSLRQTENGLRLCSNPVMEIKSLYRQSWAKTGCTLNDINTALKQAGCAQLHVKLAFSPKANSSFTFNFFGNTVNYDATAETLTTCGNTAPCVQENGKVAIELICDTCSTEAFAQQGLVYTPASCLPDTNEISFDGAEGFIFDCAEIHTLKSIWNSNE